MFHLRRVWWPFNSSGQFGSGLLSYTHFSDFRRRCEIHPDCARSTVIADRWRIKYMHVYVYNAIILNLHSDLPPQRELNFFQSSSPFTDCGVINPSVRRKTFGKNVTRRILHRLNRQFYSSHSLTTYLSFQLNDKMDPNDSTLFGTYGKSQ